MGQEDDYGQDDCESKIVSKTKDPKLQENVDRPPAKRESVYINAMDLSDESLAFETFEWGLCEDTSLGSLEDFVCYQSMQNHLIAEW